MLARVGRALPMLALFFCLALPVVLLAAARPRSGAAGVAGMGSARDGETVLFQLGTQLPGAPTKSFFYSLAPPRVTDGPTDASSFAPGEFRQVCRPLAEEWYLCLDREN